jgi:hypothetical protein
MKDKPDEICNLLSAGEEGGYCREGWAALPFTSFAIFLMVLSSPSQASAAIFGDFPFLHLSPAWGVVVIALLILAAYFVLCFLIFGIRSSTPKEADSPSRSQAADVSFSPAEAGYLFRLEYDDACLVAALVHLAHQRIISISDHHQGRMIRQESPCPGTVAPEERFLYSVLFRKHPTILFEEKGSDTLRQIQRSFMRFMNNRYGRRLSKPRPGVFLPGASLALMGGIALIIMADTSLVHFITYAGFAGIILIAGAFTVTRPTDYANRGSLAAESLRNHLTTTQIPTGNAEKVLLHFWAHLAYAVALDAARWWIARNSEALHDTGTDPTQVETEWYTDGRKGLPGLVSLIENLAKTFREMA